MSEVLARRSAGFASRFHADIYAPPDRTIVRAHGEIDRATRSAFRAALRDRPRPTTLAAGRRPRRRVRSGPLRPERPGRRREPGRPRRHPDHDHRRPPQVYRRFTLTHLVDRLDVHPTPVARTLTPASTTDPASALTS